MPLKTLSRRFAASGGGVKPVRGDRPQAVVLPEPGVSWIRYVSATRVRSIAPGALPKLPRQRPTRLREYPACHHSRYIGPHSTSIEDDLFSRFQGNTPATM